MPLIVCICTAITLTGLVFQMEQVNDPVPSSYNHWNDLPFLVVLVAFFTLFFFAVFLLGRFFVSRLVKAKEEFR